MACECAFVTFDGGGERAHEYIIDHGRNGLLVDIGDLEGVEEPLAKLCSDDRMRSRLGKSARETYSVDAVTDWIYQRCVDLAESEE
jgi:glycosyltransferase involved in cell wall biosynthesis